MYGAFGINKMDKKKVKKIKGYITVDFARKGWSKKDSAIFVYRKVKKSETWFVPCEIILNKESQ